MQQLASCNLEEVHVCLLTEVASYDMASLLVGIGKTKLVRKGVVREGYRCMIVEIYVYYKVHM